MQKFLLKMLTFVLLCNSCTNVFGGGIGNGSAGSPNISGIINQYTPVLTISNSTCSSTLTVFSAAGFVAGDLVLIIQMEGATVDITNTATSGSITSYNNAGNFEYARIISVSGNVIQTIAPLTNNYDILGITQLIRVPQYQNPVITGPLTCPAWNGIIGGVVVLDAAGTITFNADIDISGMGFRGAQSQQSLDYHYHVSDYIALNHPDSFSLKGEGIASYSIAPLVAGRGAAANAGGGGNDHNGGGGGGANGGCGGNGGYGLPDINYGPTSVICQGIGGYQLNNGGSFQKIFMGGGGGAGNADNGSNAAGANGGGIIIISANSIIGNNHFIRVNGSVAPNAAIDGAGGGGGGGSIIINCTTISATLNVSASGGNGGSTTVIPYPPHGPGGGGGGGVLAISGPVVPANIIINSLNGGISGLCDGIPHGAMAGCNGNTVLNFTPPGMVTNPTTTTYTDTAFCKSGTLPLTCTSGTTYSWSPASGLSCTNCQTPVAIVNSSTIYVATVNYSTCIYIDSFDIKINPLPNVNVNPFSDVCADAASFVLTGGTPLGGTYTGTGVNAGIFDTQISGTGTFNIVYSFTDTNGCFNADTASITVNTLPVVNFAQVNPLCISQPAFALTGGTPAGGQYSGPGVAAGIFDPIAAGAGNHQIIYSFTDANGCDSEDSITLTVYALPVVTQAALADVCEGSPILPLAGGTPAGGTYSGSGVIGSNFDPVIAGTGNHMITYTYTDINGCVSADSSALTVNPLPLVSITPPGDVCIDIPAFTLTGGSPLGGIYSGTGVIGGSFDPAAAGAGNFNITYTYTDPLGCTDSALTGIAVNPLPVVSFSTVNPVCISATPFPLTGGSPAGGLYSGPGVSVAVFDPSSAGTGVHTVYYSYTDSNGCTASDSITITVYALPVVTISSVNPVCDGIPAFALTGATPVGGIYSGAGITGNTFDPAVAGIGSHTINYSFTDLNGCSNTASTNIVINALPVVTLASFTPVCLDEPIFNLTSGAPVGGSYSGNGVSSGQFDPQIAGTGNATITYSYTDLNGCSNSATKNITVNALPVVTLPAINPVCISSTPFVLNGGSPAGGLYSGNGVTGSTFDPVAAGLGNHSVIYSYTDVNGCSSSDTTTITVYALPVVTITSVNPVCDGTLAFALTGATPAGGVYSGTGVTGSTFDPAVAGIGSHTVTYSYIDANGCSNSASTNIVINALPVVTLASFTAVCLDEPIFNLTGGNPAGGSYSGSGVSLGQFDPLIAGAGITTITYSYTDLNGCSNSATKNITVNALPVVTLPAINPVCIASASFILNGGTPAGGLYSGNGVTGNTFDPVAAGLGNHTIIYSYSDVNGCSSSDTTTITVYDLPVVTISSVNPVCDGTPAFALTGATPAGGVYSGTGMTGNIFNPAVAGIGSHTVTYSYTDANGCGNSASTNIVINALPVVTLASFTQVCVDEPVFNLTGGAPAGGSYSGSGVSTGQFDPQTAGPGITTITYSYTDLNGCSNSAIKNITVNALPVVTLPAINPVCIASASFILNGGTPAGGLYSGNGVTGNTFDPVAAGLGNHSINYSYTDANGCSASDTTTITVYDLPVVTITPVNPVCDGTPAFALTGATPAGGVYSGTGVTGSTFNPAVAGIGSHTITYSYVDPNGCGNSASTNIVINALPVVTLASFTQVCVDEPVFNLTGGAPAGGSYSGSGVSTGQFDPQTAGPGITTITYSYTDLNGCSNSAIKNITVNALPVVTLPAINPVCIASASFILNGGTPAGGLYSGNGVTGSTFDPVAAGLGNHSINYSYTDANGCSASDTTTITVYDLPVVTITPVNPVCDGTPSFALTGATPAGGVYSGTGITGSTFNPAVAGIGSHAITYSYTDPNGCGNSASTNIVINALPVVTLTPFTPVCLDAPIINLTGGNPAGGSYSGTGISTGQFDPQVAGPGNTTVTYAYTDLNGCSNSATQSITVNVLPVVALPAINPVCIASAPFVLNGGSPAGGLYSGNGVTGNTFDPVAAGLGNHTIIYSFTDVNGCSASDTTTVTVYDLPVVTIPPVNPVCDGTPAFALTGATPAGGVYSGTGITGSTFNPAVAGIGSHTITYSYTDANGCSNSSTTVITVNGLPVVSLSSFTGTCIDQPPVVLSGGSPAGGVYSGAGISGGTLDPALAGTGLHVITYSYTDLNGCTNNATENIAINPLPAVALTAFNPVCISTAAFSLISGTPAGGTYSGKGVSNGQFDPVSAGVGNHIMYYFYTDSNGCSAHDSVTVTVYDLPVVQLLSFTPVCENAQPVLLTGGSPAGGVYTGLGVAGGFFDPSVAGPGIQNITYSYTDPTGCSNTDSESVMVNALPQVTLSPIVPLCENATAIILTGGNPLGGIFSGPGVAGGNFDPALAGSGVHTISYTYTDINGCSATDTSTVTVNPLLFISAGDDDTVCSNQPLQLQVTGVSSAKWSPATGLSCSNCLNPVATVSSGVTYFISSTDPCAVSDTIVLTVVPDVFVNAGNDTTICFGEHVQLQAVSNASVFSWSGTSSLSCMGCPNPVAAPSLDSYFIVSVTNGFCTAADTVSINVTIPDVNAGIDQQIILGENIQLNASGADSCLWSPANSLSDPALLSPVASPEMTTVYTLIGYYKGCVDTDQVIINIIDIGDAIFVPGAFTPNSDGKNDFFGPVAYGNISAFEMKIYNRWGNLVFVSNNIGKWWDGVFNGKPMPDGAYVYYITLRRENQPILKTGRVDLIR